MGGRAVHKATFQPQSKSKTFSLYSCQPRTFHQCRNAFLQPFPSTQILEHPDFCNRGWHNTWEQAQPGSRSQQDLWTKMYKVSPGSQEDVALSLAVWTEGWGWEEGYKKVLWFWRWSPPHLLQHSLPSHYICFWCCSLTEHRWAEAGNESTKRPGRPTSSTAAARAAEGEQARLETEPQQSQSHPGCPTGGCNDGNHSRELTHTFLLCPFTPSNVKQDTK